MTPSSFRVPCSFQELIGDDVVLAISSGSHKPYVKTNNLSRTRLIHGGAVMTNFCSGGLEVCSEIM